MEHSTQLLKQYLDEWDESYKESVYLYNKISDPERKAQYMFEVAEATGKCLRSMIVLLTEISQDKREDSAFLKLLLKSLLEAK